MVEEPSAFDEGLMHVEDFGLEPNSLASQVVPERAAPKMNGNSAVAAASQVTDLDSVEMVVVVIQIVHEWTKQSAGCRYGGRSFVDQATVCFPEPLHVFSHTVLDADLGRVSQQAIRFCETGTGGGHVPFTRRLMADDGAPAGILLDEPNQLAYFDRIVVT